MAIKRGQYGTLSELLGFKLSSLHDIEQELIPALTDMSLHAQDKKLKELFSTHLEETKDQRDRLEKAFKLLGAPVSSVRVEAIRGLIKDAQWLGKNVKTPEALDAGLCEAALSVESFESAEYKSAILWAKTLRQEETAALLGETLKEEELAAQKLYDVAPEISRRAAMSAS